MRRWVLPLILAFCVPAMILAPAALGPRTYLPRDPATLAPAAWLYSEDELAAAAEGANLDIPEVSAWFVPELRSARAALENGSWPGWSPWTHGGTVLQAHGHTALLYPPTWIALAHPDPQDGLVWLAWLHLAAAALLTYGLMRHLGMTIAAALLAAMTFALSGTVCANAPFYPRLGSLVWLPGLLWAARALAERHRQHASTAAPALGLATCMALSWLAGFPPYSAAVTLVAAAWCLVLIARHPRRVALAAKLLAAAGLGLALAAPHLWPVLAFFPESNRAIAPELTQVSHNVFPLGGTLGYLLPDVFGHMDDPSLPADRSPLAFLLLPRHEWITGRPLLPGFVATEYAVFAGTAVLALAPLGIWLGRRRAADRPSPWFPLWALLTLLALAAGWPVVREIYRLPLIPTIAPMRFTGPAALCVAWLGAVGLDRILRAQGPARARALWFATGLAALAAVTCGSLWFCWDPETLPETQGWARTIAEDYREAATALDLDEEVVRREFVRDGRDLLVVGARRLIAGLGAASVALGLLAAWLGTMARWGSRPRVRGAAAIALIAATGWQLADHGHRANRGVMALPSSRSPVHEALAARRAEREAFGGLGIVRVSPASRAPAVPLFVPPGSLATDRVRDHQVYSFIDGRSNRPFVELQARHALAMRGLPWKRASADQRAAAREAALATIHGGAVPATLPDTAEVLGSPYLDLIGVHAFVSQHRLSHAGDAEVFRIGDHRAFVHENPGALPRAFVVPDLRAVADDEAALDALLDPAFAPRELAIVTDAVARTLQPPSRAAALDEARPVRFVRDRADEVELHIDGEGAGYLILADTFLPGWRATVNGAAAPVFRANLWMRMIALPPGPCTVGMVYTTPGLWPGLTLAILAALALVVWARLGASRRCSQPSDKTM